MAEVPMDDVARSGVARAAGASPRRRRGRLVVLVMTLLMAVFGAVLASAGPASAVGYPITYTLTNQTDQTLHLDKAQTGGQCFIISNYPVCTGGYDYSSKVHPRTVPPGQSAYVDSALDILTFRQATDINVIFGIGPNSQYGTVELRTTPYDAFCDVHNAASPNDRHYQCTQNSLRGFDLKSPPVALP